MSEQHTDVEATKRRDWIRELSRRFVDAGLAAMTMAVAVSGASGQSAGSASLLLPVGVVEVRDEPPVQPPVAPPTTTLPQAPVIPVASPIISSLDPGGILPVQATSLPPVDGQKLTPLLSPQMLPKTSPQTPPLLPEVPSELPPPRDPGRPSAVTAEPIGGLFRTKIDAPLGFTGRSSVLPREVQTDNRFIPMEDRWRIGFPPWDRYGKGHPPVDDYPYKEGHWWDPYNQNVLKGDYAFWGQNTFLVITGISKTVFEAREVPIPTTPFESTARAAEEPFFGRPNQTSILPFFTLAVDIFHGDAAFKPVDWRLKIMPVFNINYLSGQELAVVSPDVTSGLDRTRTFLALQEAFFETKLADLGPNYDFVSLRSGNQYFNNDFRGFLFSDTNLGGRIFGNYNSNREQFNIAYFKQWEKDTNSGLNSFNDRGQQIVFSNLYVQDFIWPGYTFQGSVTYNRDNPSFKFDENNFLVRPDPVGVFAPHGLDVVYFGWAGDGHINRFNITHQYYFAVGHDSLNPLANTAQNISAHFGALELSYDRDWVRFRGSAMYASGDQNVNNGHATGFDAILDDPVFAGAEFSYWARQGIRLFGVNLTNRGSFLNNLRSSKIQGQSNFVNPGLQLLNLGMDFDVTPKIRVITNANALWFDQVASLQTFLYQEQIHRFIGTDLSVGMEYRPLLNNNVIISTGLASLIPGRGFRDIYSDIIGPPHTMFAGFLELTLLY